MRKKFFWIIVFMGIIFGVYFLHPLIFDRMGKYLIVKDKLEKADVILVLAGDYNGERVIEGVKLFKRGYAKRILMSGGPVVWRLTYADWMKKQAVESGVPKKAILLQDKSMSTIDDAVYSLPVVKKMNFKSVILVTSPQHTRRAGKVFKKLYSKEGIRVIVWPAEKSDFNPDRWWTRYEDRAFVVWEYVSFVLYFLKGY